MLAKIKPATIKDIAIRANTSHATVSRVLNDTGYPVSSELKKRIITAAKEMNYTPNLIGRYLKTNMIAEIGVMVPNISNPYYSSLVLGIEEALSVEGYNVLLCNSRRDIDKEELILKNFMMKQVSGIIISSACKNPEILELIKSRNIKIVAIDQDLDNFPISKVLFDYEKGGFLATEHLIKLGHRDIAYISAPIDRVSRRKIFEGYKNALRAYGLEFNNKLVEISNEEKEVLNEGYEFMNGKKLMEKLLKGNVKFTAVFTCNDMTAIGAIDEINECGLKIPEDMAVIGCDNILISSCIKPKLSTVDYPVYEISKIAAQLLLDKIKGNDKEINLTLQPSLVIRESTFKSE